MRISLNTVYGIIIVCFTLPASMPLQLIHYRLKQTISYDTLQTARRDSQQTPSIVAKEITYSQPG